MVASLKFVRTLALLLCITHASLIYAEPANELTPSIIEAIKNNDIRNIQKYPSIKEIADSCNQNGKSALMLAVWEGREDIVRLFVQNRANLNIADKDGRTALMLAIWRENLTIVKLLVQSGADISIKNKEGLVADDIAELTGNGEIIDFLSMVKNRK